MNIPAKKIFYFTVCFQLLIAFPLNANVMFVGSTFELRQALEKANSYSHEKETEIVLEDGIYTNATNLVINSGNVTIRSRSNDPTKVVLLGNGMKSTSNIEVIFDISASYVSLIGLTLRQVSNHLIQVRGEANADYVSIDNCVFEDAFQQMIKVSTNNNLEYSDNGKITNSRFEYTKGIGPNYYIGGIDAHKARNWLISNNVFIGIASPSKQVAEHAIHFWHDSSNITVKNNLIVNSDRGIGFGLGERENDNVGGLISNNKIIDFAENHIFSDAAIILESSPETIVINNFAYSESSYPNSIEFRYPSTKNIRVAGNNTNKYIVSKDRATGIVRENKNSTLLKHYLNMSIYYFKKFKILLFKT